MKKNISRYAMILKITAVLVHPLWMFSLFLAISAFPLGKNQESYLMLSEVIIFTLLTIFYAFLGFSVNHLVGIIGKKSEAKSFLNLVKRAIWLLIMLVFLIVTFIVISPLLHHRYMSVLFIPCIVVYIVGGKQYYHAYNEILGQVWLIVSGTSSIIICSVLSLLGIETPVFTVATLFLIQLSIFLLVKGQSNIDFMMERRKHRFEHLPSNIRRYVFLLTSAVIALMFGTLFFWDGIATAFRFILNLFVILLRFLFSLIPSSQQEEIPVEEVVEASPGGMPMAEENPYAEIINTITYIITALAALAVIYKYRRQILSAIALLINKIIEQIAKLLRPTPIAGLLTAQKSNYYIDTENKILPQKVKAERKNAITAREWRRSYAKFIKMPPSAQSYRFGYRLTLLWLTMRRAEFGESDTPLEMLENVKTILPQQEWAAIIDCYNRIRYSDDDKLTIDELRELISCMDKNIVKK